MNNRQKLIDIITDRQLDRLQLAEMLKVKREQVDHWLLSNESKYHEEIPDMAIELLVLKLGIKLDDEENQDKVEF